MKKRKKPSARRRASIGIALCFAAAVVIAGTYTLTNYRRSGQQDEQEQQADSTKKKDSNSKVSAKSANTDKLTIDTENQNDEKQDQKMEQEPLRVLGKVENGQIVKAELPKITCQCIRVPVLNGHTAAVFINFEKKPTKEQLIQALRDFKGFPQEAELPSAPKQFIQYLEEDNRPQVKLDVDYEHGMGVSIGRLREDSMYDFKFIGLSHNTVRGAAGGAVLCAETLTAKGYITKK